MKTFSRKQMEMQYEHLAAYNPLIKLCISFEDLLTKDFAAVRGNIDSATRGNLDISIQHNGKTIKSPYHMDLIRQVLYDINYYGHSTVLYARIPSKDKYTLDDYLSAIRSCNEPVVVNTPVSDYYVQVWGEDAVIKFGNKKYTCKHVSHVMLSGNTEMYIPTDESERRIFVASHSKYCKTCKNKKCIRSAVGELRLYDMASDLIKTTPSAPYDFHKADCAVKSCYRTTLKTLGHSLIEYSSSKKSVKEVTEKRAEQKIHEAHEHSISVVTTSEGSEEVFIEAKKYFASKRIEYKGGHHASPTVHTVDGYWRRKSKNDDTLIFVEGFPRGGTKKQRDELRESVKQKQKVFKVD